MHFKQSLLIEAFEYNADSDVVKDPNDALRFLIEFLNQQIIAGM